MNKAPKYWSKAKKLLSKKDPVLKKIIKKFNKGYLKTRNNPFFSLCRTIVGQQISTKAAESIWLKFEKKCKKNHHIGLKLTLFLSTIFITAYFIYPRGLTEIVSKINII